MDKPGGGIKKIMITIGYEFGYRGSIALVPFNLPIAVAIVQFIYCHLCMPLNIY
jgi:hypothetical protein